MRITILQFFLEKMLDDLCSVRVHCIFQNKIPIITLLRKLPYCVCFEKIWDNLCSRYANRLCNDKKSVIEKSTIVSFFRE